jgi:hypothetical protein
MNRSRIHLLIVAAIVLLGMTVSNEASAQVGPVPAAVRKQLELSEFYSKHLDASGIPIIASSKTSDFALEEARYLTGQMLAHRPEIAKAITKAKVRIAIMAHDEWTTDIPEHSDLTPAEYWNQRARGLGATRQRPAVSCGEENLLCLEGDPYAVENIFIHEFGHVIHEVGMAGIDKTFDDRLKAAYDAALSEGLWKGAYASTNRSEYWAEAVQSWFDTNRENDNDHNHVNTRAELREYDPRVAALCEELLGNGEWRYVRPERREPQSPHLSGFDRPMAPKFAWPADLLAYREKVRKGEKGLAAKDAVSLSSRSPEDPAVRKSAAGGKGCGLWIRNLSDKDVDVAWIDFDGEAKKYATLRPGDHHEQSTFVGHVWSITRGEDDVELFVAEGKSCTIEIQPKEKDAKSND